MGNHCEEKNPCQPNPCKSGGSCTISDEDEGFQCICNSGNKGKRCELVDKCKPSPCKNAGTCEERDGKSLCLCAPEYKGPTCEEERQCFQEPCLNTATCLEHDDGFNCTCPAGFTGQFCGEHVCHPSPCMHEGRCTVESGHFKCVCPPLFRGDMCEIPHPCHIRPCLNGGLCVDSYSGYNGYPSKWNHGSLHYLCICRPGFSGLNCEVDVCKNCDPYAKCINNTCICNPGYKGDGFHCQRETRLCHPNPCKNGATCKENSQGGYDCLCVGGYSGPKCEDKNACSPSPCRHSGQCVALQDADYRCICHSSKYSGKDCEKITDPCQTNPCLNSGECINEDGKPACKCKGRFTGQFCETCDCPKANAPNTVDLICDAEGECQCPGTKYTLTPKGQCVSAHAYSPCLNRPCKNGGTCRIVGGSQYECICASPWTGNTCEKNGCSPNPCLNGGTCYVEDKLVKCHCKQPFLGPRCEQDPTTDGKSPSKKEVCHPNPCENGGVCQLVPGGYDCSCSDQFTGAHCEVDKCAKCDAQAICIAGRCRCKKGYVGTGFHCIKVSEPSGCNNCPSNAKCYQNVCQCTDGFVFRGDQCIETAHDEKTTIPHVFTNRIKYVYHKTAGLNLTTNVENRQMENPKSQVLLKNKTKSHGKIKPNISGSQMLDSKEDRELSTAHVHIYTENPCKNDAALAFTLSGTSCICKPGFKGIHCQDKDHCFKKPCFNNGTCTDHKTRYECHCKDGFKGINCEIKDNCYPNPCLHGGICHDQKGLISVRCSCRRGFKGAICKDINKCETNPCKNGGTCVQLNGDKFFCICLPEYSGTICQSIKRCLVNPCRNGGVCVEDDRQPVCKCQEGFVAEYCQDNVCKPNPCIHGGTCKPKKSLQGNWDFNCTCPKMFKGDKCEVPQPCVVHPCMHGRCIDATTQPRYGRLSDSYLCLCDKGYTGKNCRKKICDSCDVNAKCVSNQCVCNEGYLGNGLTCTLSYTSGPCSIRPCLNNGVCIELDEKAYDCRCIVGYTGPTCEKRLRCIPNPCKHGGVCFESGISYRCVCSKKFKGKDCSEKVVLQDKCSPNPCKNGGTCKTSEDGRRAYCKCPSFKFKAPFCECDCPKANTEKQKRSSDSFCDKKGDCICPRSDMYLTPWGCIPARLMDNPCSSKPCENNATCYNLTASAIIQNDKSYGCRCEPGFTGSRCQSKQPDPCSNSPCKNGGACKESKGTAVCTCKSGFSAPHCYRPEPGVSKCYPNPCLNDGECFEKDHLYNCKCKKGFTGTHCQVTVDDCKGCNSTYTFCFRGKCVCYPGFVGDGKYCVPVLKGSKVTRHPIMNVARRATVPHNHMDIPEKHRPIKDGQLSSIIDFL